MKKLKEDYEPEILEIIKTKDWDRARRRKSKNLYRYIWRHRNDDKNCKIVLKHISRQDRDFKSEVSAIVETKDWDRAKFSNDQNLYNYIRRHKDTDENCKIISKHIDRGNYESEISEIVETGDWSRAKKSNNDNLYQYILRHKDTDEDCKIVWKHISEKHSPYTIKDYLLHYFKYGKPRRNSSFYQWFAKEINRGNQCCIDIKNLIVAADTYKDPVAIETLDLIKNHLEKEDT